MYTDYPNTSIICWMQKIQRSRKQTQVLRNGNFTVACELTGRSLIYFYLILIPQ